MQQQLQEAKVRADASHNSSMDLARRQAEHMAHQAHAHGFAQAQAMAQETVRNLTDRFNSRGIPQPQSQGSGPSDPFAAAQHSQRQPPQQPLANLEIQTHSHKPDGDNQGAKVKKDNGKNRRLPIKPAAPDYEFDPVVQNAAQKEMDHLETQDEMDKIEGVRERSRSRAKSRAPSAAKEEVAPSRARSSSQAAHHKADVDINEEAEQPKPKAKDRSRSRTKIT